MKRRKGLLDEEKFLPPLPEQLPRGVSSLPGYGQTSPVAQGLLGFTGRNPTYSVMSPEAQQMSDAYRLGEQASVASQLYGSMLPFAAASTMASAQRAGSLLSPLTVFHGSPHKFSKFDASKIGTGEGAQAYGHGLYFAENPKVAQDYADVLASPRNMVSDKRGVYIEPSPVTSGKYMLATKSEVGQPYGVAGDATQFIYSDNEFPNIASAIKFAKRQGLLSKNDRPRLTAIGEDRKYIPVTKASDVENPEYTQFIASDSGSIYTVDLPDEQIAKMLDWDKPLSQQSKYVKDALSRIGITVDETGEQIYKKLTKPDSKVNVAQSAISSGDDPIWALKTFYPGITDEQINQTLAAAKKRSPDVITSSILKDAGIPGIRYLDEGSRGAKKGTSNFVVFPGEESKLRIMEVNGKPVVIDEEELRRSGLLGVAQ